MKVVRSGEALVAARPYSAVWPECCSSLCSTSPTLHHPKKWAARPTTCLILCFFSFSVSLSFSLFFSLFLFLVLFPHFPSSSLTPSPSLSAFLYVSKPPHDRERLLYALLSNPQWKLKYSENKRPCSEWECRSSRSIGSPCRPFLQ